MTLIRFPKRPPGGASGPDPIYICAPAYEDMARVKKKFGLGYSREEAKVAFYGGDPQSQEIEAKVFTLSTAQGWLKHHIVSQLELFATMDHPLSQVEQETRDRLGNDPWRYSKKGPRRKKKGT